MNLAREWALVQRHRKEKHKVLKMTGASEGPYLHFYVGNHFYVWIGSTGVVYADKTKRKCASEQWKTFIIEARNELSKNDV